MKKNILSLLLLLCIVSCGEKSIDKTNNNSIISNKVESTGVVSSKNGTSQVDNIQSNNLSSDSIDSPTLSTKPERAETQSVEGNGTPLPLQ